MRFLEAAKEIAKLGEAMVIKAKRTEDGGFELAPLGTKGGAVMTPEKATALATLAYLRA